MGSDEDGDTEYVAPDLLPDKAGVQVELQQRWDDDLPTEKVTYAYAMLHPGLMRSIISRIGAEAGLAAVYWRDGVYVYETNTQSRGMIEQQMLLDAWRGCIHVRAQRGDAGALLQRLRALVKERQDQLGMSPEEVCIHASGRLESSMTVNARAEVVREPSEPLNFAQEKPAEHEWCVSYAWGDDTAEGRERDAVVDRLCDEAADQGIKIIRDKTVLGLGDSISKFMRRIGCGDRIFVILSDKYLKSTSCMFELSEIWRTSKQEDETFRRRIRAYTLPCAKIWADADRIDYAIYWKQQHEELDARLKRHGYEAAGESGIRALRRMMHCWHDIADMLALVADTLQPTRLRSSSNMR